ncbi:MAG: glycosyltransferase family 2 protein [bacterium]
MFDFALIIPCYNETKRLGDSFEKIQRYFSAEPYFKNLQTAVIFVDDGSSDQTYELMKSLESRSTDNFNFLACRHEVNQGKGAAIKTGARRVEARNYGFIDADLAYPLELIPKMVAGLAEFDLVIGERTFSINPNSQNKIRKTISFLLQRLVAFLLGHKIADTQCGFKFFSKQVRDQTLLPTTKDRFRSTLSFWRWPKAITTGSKACP